MSFHELFKNKDKCTEFALLFEEQIKPFKIEYKRFFSGSFKITASNLLRKASSKANIFDIHP